MEDIRDIIKEFEDKHIIKQVILIGIDGAVRNIEFEAEDGNNTR